MSLIEEAGGLTDTIGLLRLSAAGVTLIETRIHTGSASAGRALADIALPAGTVVATIVHDGRPFVPAGDYRLRSGDAVLVITHTATEQEINQAFQ